jgi:hypothetical protein
MPNYLVFLHLWDNFAIHSRNTLILSILMCLSGHHSVTLSAGVNFFFVFTIRVWDLALLWYTPPT